MAKMKVQAIKVETPIENKVLRSLKAGDQVLISGQIFTARDSAHKLFAKKPPFELSGNVLYYASPTPTKKGHVIGSIGPTTSYRMDPFTPKLLKLGLRVMIGKGKRGPEVKAAMKKCQAVYLIVPGGTAAALSKQIKKSEVIAYPQLGPEAVLKLEVANFPAIVAIDCKGHDIFEIGKKKYQTK